MSCNEFTARRRVPALAFGLMTALLAGCASAPPKKPDAPLALTPTEQFPIKVASAPERIALAVHPTGLSPTQKAALSGFVSRWRSDGGGLMTVAAPAGTPGAYAAASAAVAEVVKLGVPVERVRTGHAPAGAPLLLSYERFQAEGPDCSAPWDDLTATGSNKVYSHFGCSVTANIAAQVANPRDFLAPAVVTPADDMRREVVLGKYRQGVSTSTAADQQASGKVSDALQ
jgi:pilus assembly protein CpaD